MKSTGTGHRGTVGTEAGVAVARGVVVSTQGPNMARALQRFGI